MGGPGPLYQPHRGQGGLRRCDDDERFSIGFTHHPRRHMTNSPISSACIAGKAGATENVGALVMSKRKCGSIKGIEEGSI